MPCDLYRTGSPSIFNPDGSRSNVGLNGGPFAWGSYTSDCTPGSLWVSADGDDTTGYGSSTSPFASVRRAIESVTGNPEIPGSDIYIGEGTFRLAPMPSNDPEVGIWDGNERIRLYGRGAGTILEFHGSDLSTAVSRDANVFRFQNRDSRMQSLKINFYPNRTANYSNAIARFSYGTIENVYFENLSSADWSYSYFNGGTGPTFLNCTFDSHGNATSDYSGSPTYVNSLWDRLPSLGTRTYYTTRPLNPANDMSTANLPCDVYQTGSPSITNPDGSRSHLGIYGGPLAWTEVPTDCTPGTLYVETWGSDTEGWGSAARPFATIAHAVDIVTAQYAWTGHDIVVGAGTFRLAPIVFPGTTIGLTDHNTDYSGSAKAIRIRGQNADTVLEFRGADNTSTRDASALHFTNAQSGVSNLTIDFYPNRTASYSNAIARESIGTVTNVHFRNRSTTTSWTYGYYNSGTGPTYRNCTFQSNGRSVDDYSGAPTYDNSLWDVIPSRGTRTNYRTRAITADDLSAATIPADLRNTGNPGILNSDGTRSNIGVAGGPNLWP